MNKRKIRAFYRRHRLDMWVKATSAALVLLVVTSSITALMLLAIIPGASHHPRLVAGISIAIVALLLIKSIKESLDE